MKQPLESQGVLQIPIPGHPGLTLVSAQLVHYGPELLGQVQACLEQSLTPREELTPVQLRDLLRRIDRPSELGSHPWVRAWGADAPERAGARFAEAVRTAITCFEATRPTDRRGPILRLRYLEGVMAKAVRQALYLSESHYHRLHAAGLHWLADELIRLSDAEAQRMGALRELCKP
jgi:hypothetical protein